MAIFNFARLAPKLCYYGDVIYSFYWKSAVEHDGGVVIVYPARDIRPFVMYCVNGKPRSSLLIESTDSMIYFCHTFCMYPAILWLQLQLLCLVLSEPEQFSVSGARNRLPGSSGLSGGGSSVWLPGVRPQVREGMVRVVKGRVVVGWW